MQIIYQRNIAWQKVLPIVCVLLCFPIISGILLEPRGEGFLFRTGNGSCRIFGEVFLFAVGLLGLVIRLSVNGYDQGTKVKPQYRKGLYNIVRHPLAVGNFFLGLAPILRLDNLCADIVYIGLFAIYGFWTVAREKRQQTECNDPSYLNWFKATPAFIPCSFNWSKPDRVFSWRKNLRVEYVLFLGLVTAMAATDYIGGQLVQQAFRFDYNWFPVLTLAIACSVIVFPFCCLAMIAICTAFLLTAFGKTAKAQQFDVREKSFLTPLFSPNAVFDEYSLRFFTPQEPAPYRTSFRQYEPNKPNKPSTPFFTPDQKNNLFRGQSQDDDGPPKFYKIGIAGAWTPSGGNGSLGMTRFKTEAAIMFPGIHFPQMKERSLLGIAPTFSYTSFDWKRDTVFPKQAYEAGLEFTLMQPLNNQWGFMGKVMPQWAGDGKESSRTISCSAMFGLRWEPNSRWEVMFGVMYLGQNADMSVLPFGGVVWRPNDDWRIELMVPQAKIAKRLNINDRLRDHWLYVGAGFDGGNWGIRSVDGKADLAMYQEFNIVAGYEISKNEIYSCALELGYVFGREMKFDRKTQSTFRPDNAFTIQLKFEF
ncbi:MAG: DUF6268 family outer membrane beta-barrel protein [Planctomycetaceae bacterium]|jgi:protein-S-isoprenylcysteine O-methyltransferase Ste14|nr:DUF6268 family outer membrane beta-barrel protein [Planctomycetaceae bacterium]